MTNNDQPKGQAELTEAQQFIFDSRKNKDYTIKEFMSDLEYGEYDHLSSLLERYAALKSNHVKEQTNELGYRFRNENDPPLHVVNSSATNIVTAPKIEERETGWINIVELEAERLEWSLKTFPEATYLSSLEKLKAEIKEVAKELKRLEKFPDQDPDNLALEYADCLMCLFDSAGRASILPNDIFEAFSEKLVINKNRVWNKNPDNTYSHVKHQPTKG